MDEQELQMSSHRLFGVVVFSLALALMGPSSNIFQVTFQICIGQLTWSRRHGGIMAAFHRAGPMCWTPTSFSPEKEVLTGWASPWQRQGFPQHTGYAEAQLTHWEQKFGLDQLRAVSWLLTLAKRISLFGFVMVWDSSMTGAWAWALGTSSWMLQFAEDFPFISLQLYRLLLEESSKMKVKKVSQAFTQVSVFCMAAWFFLSSSIAVLLLFPSTHKIRLRLQWGLSRVIKVWSPTVWIKECSAVCIGR